MRHLLMITWLLAGCLVFAGDTFSARLLNFEITVREKPAGEEAPFALIEKKQVQLVEGLKTNAFIVNFTIDITTVYNDSGYFDCEFSVFTLGPQTQNFFKSFQSQPGGIYFLENVRGKNGAVYRVGISPISVDSTEAGEQACDFDYRQDGVWNFDPSAHFDFYFVPKSLADARWNMLRDFMEINFKDFKELFQLSFPGKSNCFFSPCMLPEVIWDKRMGFAIDPPRANCFVLYTHENNTVDPVPAYLVRLYRYLGYAPPLLAEGMAAYFEFPHYYAHSLKQTDELPTLSMMLKTVDYNSLPGLNGISAASSFVKYLIDTKGYYRFSKLYRAATDLNLEEQFKAIYEVEMEELEAEWHTLLDTINFSYGNFVYFYERERFIQRDYGMDLFMEELIPRLTTFKDSTYVISENGWNLYMAGDYEPARQSYETLLQLSPNNSNYLIIYGNLLLIDGQYDSSRVMYNRLLLADTTVKTALYKIGESYYWQNEIDSADKYLSLDMSEDRSQLSRSSSAILLGELALADHDTASAIGYYNQAVALMDQVYNMGKSRPAYLLRLGQAHFGLALCGESTTASARSFFESALYFEVHPTRVIFVTRILRELGRLADFDGRRDEAIEYYQRTLTYPLPPVFEKQVRDHIVSPFNGFAD
ncbi:MAG: tetratricopeptide repeat protein [FCB group bacterium]|nr:tetratricopeptide repeat protein [FCB group bacterium]